MSSVHFLAILVGESICQTSCPVTVFVTLLYCCFCWGGIHVDDVVRDSAGRGGLRVRWQHVNIWSTFRCICRMWHRQRQRHSYPHMWHFITIMITCKCRSGRERGEGGGRSWAYTHLAKPLPACRTATCIRSALVAQLIMLIIFISRQPKKKRQQEIERGSESERERGR